MEFKGNKKGAKKMWRHGFFYITVDFEKLKLIIEKVRIKTTEKYKN